ncbi:MAG: hypothetical protein JWO58_2294 [Chitinophagaceae bacterium]|nr:hypothetical protein [Chitinophagaceae bacterium]
MLNLIRNVIQVSAQAKFFTGKRKKLFNRNRVITPPLYEVIAHCSDRVPFR